MPLKTLIVEDEPLSRHYINNLLLRFPEVQVVDKVATEEEAISAINNLHPDLIFLDLELHTGNGFEVLKKIQSLNFTVVFTTALDHYALKMIMLSGVPFLQKPIDAEELEAIIKKIYEGTIVTPYRNALKHLKDTLQNNNVPVHMVLQQDDGREYILMDDLVRIGSAGNESILYLKEGVTKSNNKTIKDFENMLQGLYFFRVNAADLINLKHVERENSNTGTITMKDGSTVGLSPKKRDEFLLKFGNL